MIQVNVFNSLAQFVGKPTVTGTKAAAAAARPLSAANNGGGGGANAGGSGGGSRASASGIGMPMARSKANRDASVVADSTMHYGQCTVHVTWYGYRKYDKKTSRITSLHEFELPSYKYTTKALWVEIPPAGAAAVAACGLELLEAIHAAQHLLLASLSVFVSCDPGDVGTEHAYPFQERMR